MRSPKRRWTVASLALGLVVAISSSAATAAPRMPVGFHDDATFRWGAGAATALTSASAANASVIRTIANWRSIAPREPGRATDSFDPAYRFSSLDDLVRNAQRNGLQVMITLWGTPRWANDSQGPNVAPKRSSDLEDFGRAIADRYSGRHSGFPHVGRQAIVAVDNQLVLAPLPAHFFNRETVLVALQCTFD